MRAALTRYRVMAYVTGVFLLLLCLNMVLKYLLDQEGLGDWIPIGHGWLYMGYVAVTVDLWFRTRPDVTRLGASRLDVPRTVFVVLAGTIPFASFFAERWVSHQVQPLIEAETGGRRASAAP